MYVLVNNYGRIKNSTRLIHMRTYTSNESRYIVQSTRARIPFALKGLFFVGTNVGISPDWPKNANFVPANISYMHYRTLEHVNPALFPRINSMVLNQCMRPSRPQIPMLTQLVIFSILANIKHVLDTNTRPQASNLIL